MEKWLGRVGKCLTFCTFSNISTFYNIFLLPSRWNGLEMVSSFSRLEKVQNIKHCPTLHSNFSNYYYGSTNYKNISLICIICENFSFQSLTVKKWQAPLWKVRKSTKCQNFPTLHSHFSNYYYVSTNYKNISLICIICENFSFQSLTVKKWQAPLWKVRKSTTWQTFSNSAQSFFQLCLRKYKL